MTRKLVLFAGKNLVFVDWGDLLTHTPFGSAGMSLITGHTALTPHTVLFLFLTTQGEVTESTNRLFSRSVTAPDDIQRSPWSGQLKTHGVC